MSSKRGRLAISIAAATAVHALLGAVVPSFTRREPAPASSDALRLELRVEAALRAEPPREDAAQAVLVSPEPRHAGSLLREARAPGASSSTEATIGEPPIEPSEHPPDVDHPSPSLAPADVARAFLAPGWVLDSDAPDAPVMDVSPSSAGASEQDVERALSSDLRARAMTKTHLARERPEVVAQADGSHVYVGHAFTATIRRDGSVAFSDQPAVDVSRIGVLEMERDGSISLALRGRGRAPPVLPELLTKQGGIIEALDRPTLFDLAEGRVALEDELMRAAGQDPYFAEREWFMEHTAELREELEDRFAEVTRARALRALPRRLTDLWRDPARTAAQRRAALFELWDECAEDEHGEAARAAIIAFIRAHARVDSTSAYTAEELESLNASRVSAARFAPYVTPPID